MAPSIVIGYLVCFVSYYYPIGKFIKVREQNPMKLQPEARLWWLCISKSLKAYQGFLGLLLTALQLHLGLYLVSSVLQFAALGHLFSIG